MEKKTNRQDFIASVFCTLIVGFIFGMAIVKFIKTGSLSMIGSGIETAFICALSWSMLKNYKKEEKEEKQKATKTEIIASVLFSAAIGAVIGIAAVKFIKTGSSDMVGDVLNIIAALLVSGYFYKMWSREYKKTLKK